MPHSMAINELSRPVSLVTISPLSGMLIRLSFLGQEMVEPESDGGSKLSVPEDLIDSNANVAKRSIEARK